MNISVEPMTPSSVVETAFDVLPRAALVVDREAQIVYRNSLAKHEWHWPGEAPPPNLDDLFVGNRKELRTEIIACASGGIVARARPACTAHCHAVHVRPLSSDGPRVESLAPAHATYASTSCSSPRFRLGLERRREMCASRPCGAHKRSRDGAKAVSVAGLERRQARESRAQHTWWDKTSFG